MLPAGGQPGAEPHDQEHEPAEQQPADPAVARGQEAGAGQERAHEWSGRGRGRSPEAGAPWSRAESWLRRAPTDERAGSDRPTDRASGGRSGSRLRAEEGGLHGGPAAAEARERPASPSAGCAAGSPASSLLGDGGSFTMNGRRAAQAPSPGTGRISAMVGTLPVCGRPATRRGRRSDTLGYRSHRPHGKAQRSHCAPALQQPDGRQYSRADAGRRAHRAVARPGSRGDGAVHRPRCARRWRPGRRRGDRAGLDRLAPGRVRRPACPAHRRPGGCRYPGGRWRSPGSTASRCDRRGGDLVHAPTLLAPPRGRRPLVVTVHDAVPWTHPETLTPRGVRWHRRMAERAVPTADALVVPTHAVAAELASLPDPAGRVVVSGAGVGEQLGSSAGRGAAAAAARRAGRRLPAHRGNAGAAEGARRAPRGDGGATGHAPASRRRRAGRAGAGSGPDDSPESSGWRPTRWSCSGGSRCRSRGGPARRHRPGRAEPRGGVRPAGAGGDGGGGAGGLLRRPRPGRGGGWTPPSSRPSAMRRCWARRCAKWSATRDAVATSGTPGGAGRRDFTWTTVAERLWTLYGPSADAAVRQPGLTGPDAVTRRPSR